MRVEEIDEPVEVGAVFRERRLVPKWFLWGRIRHVVEQVHLSWKGREGEADLRRFSVGSGGNTYQLLLNQKTLEWRLEKVNLE